MAKFYKKITLIAVGIVFLWASNSFLQEGLEDFQSLTLIVGQVKSVPTQNPKRVAVGNPSVADVQSVANDEVVIEPKSKGYTSLFIWDTLGEHSYRLKVFSEDLNFVKAHADELIKELELPGVSTKISEAEGKILLTGEVKDNDEKERLVRALTSIKGDILDLTLVKQNALIQIDVQVLEITRDDLKNLGLAYKTAVTLTDDASKKMNKITDMFNTSMWTRSALDTQINLLVKESKGRILSQPKLVCISGKEAEFLVGGQIPVITTTLSSTGTATNVTYKNYGINLRVKPILKENDNIFTNINTEVSEVDKANAITAGGISIPAFLTREATTDLYLKSGQSVIIAGLIKNKDSNVVQKFPGLGELPILGMLFRSRDFQNSKTELVIIITPTVLRNLEGKQAKASAKSNLKSSQKENSKSPLSVEDYSASVKDRIIASISYPELAKEQGLEGTVRLKLCILSSGELKDVLVYQSSGSSILDAAATSSIKRLSPFAPFPSTIEKSEIWVEIPITYSSDLITG